MVISLNLQLYIYASLSVDEIMGDDTRVAKLTIFGDTTSYRSIFYIFGDVCIARNVALGKRFQF
jgi:hypothetical protein